MSKYYGKYRGTVENNVDPLMLGRVQVSCPSVLASGQLSWAMPCVPFEGFFMVPAIGTKIWVEFEGGDPDYPILAGCFWGTGEVPADPAVAQQKVIKTEGITLTLSDVPGGGGVKLEVGSPGVAVPLKLVMDSTGIELSMGANSVKLTSASVSINNGALEVM
ncbi:MAG: phage baseplate assembly protein V [Fimbriimonas sp.]|nr:phage baseplate assembly protein V [Fimbriimonas sp.]